MSKTSQWAYEIEEQEHQTRVRYIIELAKKQPHLEERDVYNQVLMLRDLYTYGVDFDLTPEVVSRGVDGGVGDMAERERWEFAWQDYCSRKDNYETFWIVAARNIGEHGSFNEWMDTLRPHIKDYLDPVMYPMGIIYDELQEAWNEKWSKYSQQGM